VRNEGVSITATWEGNALALVLSQTKGWERHLDALEPTLRPASASLGHRKVQAPDGRQGTQHAKRTLPVGVGGGQRICLRSASCRMIKCRNVDDALFP